MKQLEGYRTIIIALVGLAVAALGRYGIVIDLGDQASIVAGVAAIVGICLRLITKGPVANPLPKRPVTQKEEQD